VPGRQGRDRSLPAGAAGPRAAAHPPGRLAGAIVRAAARLVPADARDAWLRQWVADLHHHREWLVEAGVPHRRASRELARRASGACRHAAWLRRRHWRTNMLLQDLKYASRAIVRRPGFSLVIVLTLALGIGANATIFSWIDALVYRTIPGIQDEASLVFVHGTTATRRDLSVSYPNYRDLRDARPDGFIDFAAFRNVAVGFRPGGSEPERGWAEIVSGNYFDVLGVRPAHGRLLSAADDAAEGAGTVVVISDRLWRTRFGARQDAIGSAIVLNGLPFTLIGVTPPHFKGAANGLAADLWVPLSMQRAVRGGSLLTARGTSWLFVIGRLAPGVSPDRAQASLSAAARRLETIDPVNRDRGLQISSPANEGAGEVLVPVMSVVMAVVAVVLVIACANIAGLLLARGAARRREVALRLAVGASRGQIVRILLIESLLLASAGGAAGLAVAGASTGLLGALLPEMPFQVLIPAAISPRVVLVALAAVVLSTILFGLLPALQASRPSLVPALREGGGSVGSGGGRTRLRRVLVVAQVALALVLLVGAGLFTRTLLHAQLDDPGFDEREALLASIDLTAARLDEAAGQAFYRDLIARLEDVPGVRRASVASQVPLAAGGFSDTSPTIDGYTPAKGEDVTVYYSAVSSHYFDSLRVPIVAGRGLTDLDEAKAPLEVVINETMARRYWPGRDALGGRLDYGSGWATVVGIARDGKIGSVSDAPRNLMYMPMAQVFRATPTLIVATSVDPSQVLPEIRRVVGALNPDLPLFDVRTLAEHLDASVFLPRIASGLLAAFGGLALLLAVIGLYGVIAFNVATRTREIGVRLALGAERARIRREVLAQGLRLTVAGLAIGVTLAALAAPLLSSQLVGVGPLDAVVFGLTSIVLLLVATTATWLPAWRASRIDPIEALRE